MEWPDLFYLVIGVSCEWVTQPCEAPYGPYLYIVDGRVVTVLLLTLIGFFTCLRWSVHMLRRLLPPRYSSPEERVIAQLRQRTRQASADYLDPYL